MPIAIDQASLGTGSPAGTGSTIAFTTSSTVASGGFIVLGVYWWHATVTLLSVAGGGLTWTVDAQGSSGSMLGNVGVVSAQAPAGLASGTTITATLSAATADGRAIGGTSFTGVATSAAVDVAGTVQGQDPGTAWTTGSLSLAAGSVLVGVSFCENGTTTSTPTGPAVEALDFRSGGGDGVTLAYRIEAAGGSVATAGTWSVSGAHSDIGVAYKAAAGGAFLSALNAHSPAFIWAFNEPSGSVVEDLTANNRDATLTGGTRGQTSAFTTETWTATLFNGTTDEAVITHAAALEPSPFTLIMVLKRNGNLSQWAVPYIKVQDGTWADGYGFVVPATDNVVRGFVGHYNDNNADTVVAIPDGTFTMLSLTFSTPNIAMNVDGVEVDTGTGVNTFQNTGNVQVAMGPGGTHAAITVACVALIPSQLSAAQLATIWAARNPPVPAPSLRVVQSNQRFR